MAREAINYQKIITALEQCMDALDLTCAGARAAHATATAAFDELSRTENRLHEVAVACAEAEQERDRLTEQNAELLAALKTVVAYAPDPYCAITRAVDAQARIAIANAEQKGGE